MDWATIIIGFCGGLGLFIYGMNIMASGLQKAAGNSLKKVLKLLTKNKYLGILLGAAVTAVIQSSSATTVMVVGFVNASLMNLHQAVGVIMGANIGTTVTGLLVSAGDWAKFLQPETIAPIAVFIGAAVMLFSSKSKSNQVGEILVGFGILFVGISMMSEGVEPLKGSPAFVAAFREFGKNPVLGVIVGAGVTALIQSSSASVGILMSLALTGMVSWDSAVYIIMGQNIGTCVTAILSGLGANQNAKGAAYIHLLFNVIGSIIFSIIAFVFFIFYPEIGNMPINRTEIAAIHICFNIANTLLMLPFSGLLVKAAEFLCNRAKNKNVPDEGTLVHLDDRILNQPSIAISNCVKEIVRLGNASLKNLVLACDSMLKKGPKEDLERIMTRETKIDDLTKGITQFMVKLCNTNITPQQNEFVTSLFHAVHDLERIGDHCENLAESTQSMIDDELEFSSDAKAELANIFNETEKCVRNSLIAFEDNDIDFAEKVIKEEERVDNLEKTLRQKHIERLSASQCNPLVGVVFLDVLTNLERISDLALNVAQVVIENKTHNNN